MTKQSKQNLVVVLAIITVLIGAIIGVRVWISNNTDSQAKTQANSNNGLPSTGNNNNNNNSNNNNGNSKPSTGGSTAKLSSFMDELEYSDYIVFDEVLYQNNGYWNETMDNVSLSADEYYVYSLENEPGFVLIAHMELTNNRKNEILVSLFSDADLMKGKKGMSGHTIYVTHPYSIDFEIDLAEDYDLYLSAGDSISGYVAYYFDEAEGNIEDYDSIIVNYPYVEAKKDDNSVAYENGPVLPLD